MANIAPIKTSLEISAIINNGQRTLAALGLEIVNEEMQGIDNQNILHQDKIYRLLLIDIILFNILDQFGNILNYYQSSTNAVKFNKILTGLQNLSNNYSGPSIPMLVARNTSSSFVAVPGSGSGSLVPGSMILIGDYDASSNQFPTSTPTIVGQGGIVKKGNMWDISVFGSPGGYDMYPGATILAKIDNPGQLISNWRIWD